MRIDFVHGDNQHLALVLVNLTVQLTELGSAQAHDEALLVGMRFR
jgi:hypothetical protein